MKSVSEQLRDYLQSVAPTQVSSGDLQRMTWTNKDGTLAVPRTVVRRLQELAEEGTLTVETKKKNHAWYCYGAPAPKPKQVMTQMFTPDGRPYMKLSYV